MKILNLSISNVMKIAALECSPEGKSVTIKGCNASGKSAVLNAIAFALGGTKLIPLKPIKEGEHTAEVVVDLGKYTVTRKWTLKGSIIKVSSKDGAVYAKPQKMLDDLIGNLTFNPIEFMRVAPKKQREQLLEIVDIGIDLEKNAAIRLGHYTNRSDSNRLVKQYEGELSAYEGHSDVRQEEVSLSAILEEIRKAKVREDENGLVNCNHVEWCERVTTLAEEVEEAKKSLAESKALYKTACEQEIACGLEVDNLKDTNLEELKSNLATAENDNIAIREHNGICDKVLELTGKLQSAKDVSENFSGKIKLLDADKEEAMNKAVFPVDGLSCDAECILWNGIPLEQASAGEQLKVSMAIAMSKNPEIRVILLPDASLLDAENLKVIREMAEEQNFQVWIERVSDDDDCSIEIAAGE